MVDKRNYQVNLNWWVDPGVLVATNKVDVKKNPPPEKQKHLYDILLVWRMF